VPTRELESAVWSIAGGHGSEADLQLLRADEHVSLLLLERLIADTEDDIVAVRRLPGGEREQVVADFAATLQGLLDAAALLLPEAPTSNYLAPEPVAATSTEFDDLAFEEVEPGEVELQATWFQDQVVVWAGGRGVDPASHDDLSTRLEKVGGPPHGWQLHKGVSLPSGARADSLAISMKDALGWLVAVGGGEAGEGLGASVVWMGRVALEGVRLVASGAVVPSLKVLKRPDNGPADAAVRWLPALGTSSEVDALVAAMPPTAAALGGGDARWLTSTVMASVVETIMLESIERMELPAQPPNANTPIDLNDTIIARMDGQSFKAHGNQVADLSRKIEQWNRSVIASNRRTLVVELDAPVEAGVWVVSVKTTVSKGRLVPIDVALRTEGSAGLLHAEWTRFTRLMPAIDRASARRRGQVGLSQDEAWDFMTTLGPTLAAAGFEVRVPPMSRRKAKPSLRLFAETPAGSVVGAHQLSNVAWTVLFDDLELTAAQVAHLARQARPLVQANGKWVEVDRLDLEKAAAALAERADVTTMTGAEILRASIGLDGSGLAGGTVVHGNSWAADILAKAGTVSASAVSQPDGFVGELRTYQAEALGWLGFLDAAELGGCLALDMGLGKTPTMLAHLARCRGNGPALVVAPAAVVGNWAREAGRFAPALRVLVHHGADRYSERVLAERVARHDLVITTYATAVRDMEALASVEWGRLVLDEAQAIKNPTSDTSQQLRRLPARSRVALTGTPIENGLGDLWAILDFTNPGLVGSRSSFVQQMSGDGEAALKALNGILVFRRTKAEPEVARELPDKIDELDHCTMTPEQIGLYQAVLDTLVADVGDPESAPAKQGAILAAITALKQICNHPSAYRDDGAPLAGRSGKLARLEEIVESVFAAGERVLVFTHFATWGRRLAQHLTEVTGTKVECYDGSLARGVRDSMITEFQANTGPGALVLSLKAGGVGLNLTNANHVVLYDRWWNPAVEDQARDRAWRIGQSKTVISHRLVCPGTVDERVEEVVAGKRHIANLILPASSSLADLNVDQLRVALGLRTDELLTGDDH